MKQFELNLTYRRLDGQLVSFDKLEDDNLHSLLAQFNLVIARVCQVRLEELQTELRLRGLKEDDIPF